MANNYLLFSEVLPNLTEEEAEWLRSALESEDGVDLEPDEEHLIDDGYWPNFCWQFFDDDHRTSRLRHWGRHLWIYSDEYGDPETKDKYKYKVYCNRMYCEFNKRHEYQESEKEALSVLREL